MTPSLFHLHSQFVCKQRALLCWEAGAGMGLALGSFLGKPSPLAETNPPGDQGLSPLLPAPLIPLKSWWHMAPSPAHSSGGTCVSVSTTGSKSN